MKKIFLIIVAVNFSLLAMAGENPEFYIDNKHKFTNRTTITWEDFEDVTEVCKGITYDKKHGGKFIQSYGCAFWDKGRDKKNNCLVFTRQDIKPSEYGFIISHCFSGNVKK
ncbi:hypothetical protein G6719_09160 [Polynucleobacter paneuropaeus]|nr:hypothetical protein G6719_09160 [Polynucleobacter paneuropaeus]